ncbi:hypothetical protein HT136_23160 [Novosphingobium profundi]|uniref:hypothetical protein n=1 Tax=Novosphingobium profundi TaxID=1774954 RepID=UPI001BD9E3CF|nr:hypothetical protein [Novosphingobium profundi]MBT0671274.1 hypothetical protein [Novosphingobium profundi]
MSHYESYIEFMCPECGELVQESIVVPETNWTGDNADERHVQDHDVVECENCNNEFDFEVNNHDGTIMVQLDEFPQIKVNAGDAVLTGTPYEDYEDGRPIWWSDFASNPYKELNEALVEIVRMNSFHGSPGVSMMNRMLFTQAIAAMEAYLCDTLLASITTNRENMLKLLDGDKELKATKLSLADVFRDPDAVTIQAVGYVKDLLFHNLPKTKAIYALVGVDIFPSQAVSTKLHKAMSLRHDCIHRNGRTKDGQVLAEVNNLLVSHTASEILEMANHIESQIWQAEFRSAFPETSD